MQLTTIFVTLAAIATLALAAPQCDTAEVQCCNHITKAGDPEAQQILNEIGAIVDDLTVSVGIDCNPITGIGAGLGSCNYEPVCCENNSFGSAIAIGCVPVNAA